MSFNPKNEVVFNRSLKVQKLSIPFTVTGNATPASVVLRNDEPAVMFIKSEGVDQITAAIPSGETVTFTTAPDDSDGILNILVKINEPILKLVSMRCANRASGAAIPAKLGSATGVSVVSSGSGTCLMIVTDSGVDYSSANEDACLEVEYIAAE